jgi:ERCC4-type nuclease
LPSIIWKLSINIGETSSPSKLLVPPAPEMTLAPTHHIVKNYADTTTIPSNKKASEILVFLELEFGNLRMSIISESQNPETCRILESQIPRMRSRNLRRRKISESQKKKRLGISEEEMYRNLRMRKISESQNESTFFHAKKGFSGFTILKSDNLIVS